jgi:regulator of cell morphogenesis and NO signaling
MSTESRSIVERQRPSPRASIGASRSAVDHPTPASSLPLRDLVRHIVARHHEYTRKALDRLDRLSAGLAATGYDKNIELLRVRRLLQAMDWDLRPHLMKEEETLFPYIERLDVGGRGRRHVSAPSGGAAHFIRMMLHEHVHVETSLRELRSQTQGYTVPAHTGLAWRALYAGLQELERDLIEHIQLETNVLFPRAIALEHGLTDERHPMLELRRRG